MWRKTILIILLGTLFFAQNATGADYEQTRQTLAGLPGFMVVIEDFQPSLMKYAAMLKKFSLSKEELQREIEASLRNAGIGVLSHDVWLKTKGCPLLYININTHETERYFLAYNIRLEVQQVVTPEFNPRIRLMATTWSQHITGSLNIGSLNILKQDTMVLLSHLIQAYHSVNPRK